MKTLSFVIPVFNEEKRLEKTFTALESAVLPRGFKLSEIIFVDDGSVDKTYQMLCDFHVHHASHGKKSKRVLPVRIVSYKRNRGKGYAIKMGMHESTADYTLFFDADMSTPLSELSKFVPFMNKQIDVIIGTRKNGHSTVITHQPLIRELLGKGFTALTRLILNVWITDFTCGFKAFSKSAREKLFAHTVINRWGYDAEIIFLAKRNRLSMVEKSVLWSDDRGTKVKLYHAIPETMFELVKIRFHYTVKPAFSPKTYTNAATKIAELII